jgi:hypothetical protein
MVDELAARESGTGQVTCQATYTRRERFKSAARPSGE